MPVRRVLEAASFHRILRATETTENLNGHSHPRRVFKWNWPSPRQTYNTSGGSVMCYYFALNGPMQSHDNAQNVVDRINVLLAFHSRHLAFHHHLTDFLELGKKSIQSQR